MKLNTEGIVLSEQKLTGGKCLLTILTRNNGILRCFAKDAKKILQEKYNVGQKAIEKKQSRKKFWIGI